MKKIQTAKKLSLHAETVRDLESMTMVRGGALGTVLSLFTGACRGCTTGCGSVGTKLCN